LPTGKQLFLSNNKFLLKFKFLLNSELGGTLGPFSNDKCLEAIRQIPDHFENVKKYVKTFKSQQN